MAIGFSAKVVEGLVSLFFFFFISLVAYCHSIHLERDDVHSAYMSDTTH